MSEWQPIETAPKDGTKILLNSYFGVVIARFVYGVWMVRECADSFYSVEAEHPTHWMPLPAPPQD